MAQVREGMRARRLSLGLTQEALAERMGIAVNTYRDWELGKAMPLPGRRPGLGRGLEVTREVVDAWLDGADQAVSTPDGVTVPEWYDFYVSFEQGAASMWAYEPSVIPGLLQTRAYATAIEEGAPEDLYETTVAERVELRLDRQQALTRTDPDPLHLSVVIDGGVLNRVTGGRAVMAEQLSHLARAATMPNVDLRVVSFDGRRSVPGLGNLILLTLPRHRRPILACTDSVFGLQFSRRRDEMSSCLRLAEYIESRALSSADSVELIEAAIKERLHS